MQKVLKTGKYLKLKNLTLSMGNGKLDKSILIFNLPSGKTCPHCEDCFKTCYAHKFEKLYPQVLPCREKNLQASLKSDFIESIRAIIEKSISYGVNAIRVHESGDFYHPVYAQQWESISDFFPKIQFFAYTKSPYRPISKNFNIVNSILPDHSLNYGKIEYVKDKAKKFNYPICPATLKDKVKSTICGLTCKICQVQNYVLFVQH